MRRHILVAILVEIGVQAVAYMGGYNFDRGLDGANWALASIIFPVCGAFISFAVEQAFKESKS